MIVVGVVGTWYFGTRGRLRPVIERQAGVRKKAAPGQGAAAKAADARNRPVNRVFAHRGEGGAIVAASLLVAVVVVSSLRSAGGACRLYGSTCTGQRRRRRQPANAAPPSPA